MDGADNIAANSHDVVHGVLCAYRFGANNRIDNLEEPPALEHLNADDGWLWVHLSLADERARTFVAKWARLTAYARRTLLQHNEHPMLGVFDGFVYGIFDDLERSLTGRTSELAKLHFALNDRLIVTARRHPLHAVAEVRAKIDAGVAPASPSALLENIVQEFADAIDADIVALSDALEEIEDRVIGRWDFAADRPHLTPLRQKSMKLHRRLMSFRGLFRRFEQRASEDGPADFAGAAIRMARRLNALDQDAFDLQERARLLHEEMNTLVNIESNKRLQFLSIYTALLLPPTLVTGFFGMNTKDLPWNQTDNGKLFAAIAVATSVAIATWILKRSRAF